MSDRSIFMQLGQLRVDEGARRPPAGNVHVIEARRGAARSTLYLLLDGAEPDALAETARRIREAYRRGGSHSVTTALIRALQDGLSSPSSREPSSDVSAIDAIAVAHRGAHLYFARVGASHAFIFRQGLGEMVETHAVEGFEDERPIELGHYDVQAGDYVLLVGPGGQEALASLLSPFLSDGAAEDVEPQQILEEFHRSCRDAFPESLSVALLVAEEGDYDYEDVPPVSPPPARRGRRAGRPIGRSRSPGYEQDDDDGETEGAEERRGALAWLKKLRASRIRMILSVVAVAAVLSLVLVAALGQNMFEGSVSTLLAQAEQRERVAEYTSDAVSNRSLLAEAEHYAARAAARAPDDRGALATHSRIRKKLDAIDGVITPSWSTRLLTTTGARQAILQEDMLFVLDTAEGTLSRYRLAGNALAPAEGDPVLLRRGDRAGYITANDLLAMVWMPAGGARDKAALLALDRSGLLFEYGPGQDLSVLLLRSGPAWDKVRALAGYAGMLYLLDTQSKDILWYPATADGYNGPIYRYLDPTVDLNVATAQDMKVDEDLFILMGDGQVKKLRLGKPQPFELRPPDGPLQEPRRLFLDDNSLYVADVARYRIVEFDRDGNYVQQLRYESNENVFADLRDFVVDKAHRRLVIVNRKGVYLLEWPTGG